MADGSGLAADVAAPHCCHICGHHGRAMALIFGKWRCRDRVDCYQRWAGRL